jgi:pimeloyl-ACP methyl ester carboxylesterase
VNFCSDYTLPVADYDEWRRLVEQAGRRRAPDVRVNPNAVSRIADCLGYPYDVPNPQHELHVDGAPPLLLVNPVADPITGLNQARNALRQIGGDSVLVTYDGAGHAAYRTARGSACITQIVDRHLLTTEPPAPDTHCPTVPYQPSN